MIQKEDFDKYCKGTDDFIRIQDNFYPQGDLCFTLSTQGYAILYNCADGYEFGVPIRSIGNMKALYQMLTNEELKETT